MKKVSLSVVVLCCLANCSTLQDATPTQRSSFIRFYEKPNGYFGQVAEVTDEGGYILAANEVNGFYSTAYITLTDAKGNILKELPAIDSSSISAIKVVSDGYLIFGNRIKVNVNAQQVSDVQKSKIQLIKLDKAGNMSTPVILGTGNAQTDVRGNAITINKAGTIIGVGTITPSGGKSSAFLLGFNPSTLDTIWTQVYSTDNNSSLNYVNSNSVHITTNGDVIWASSLEESSQSQSYLVIPTVPVNSTFVNNGQFGQNFNQFYTGADIQPSPLGYGIIGTYSDTQVLPNVYFVRLNEFGSVITDSQRYYDGIKSRNNTFFDEADKASSTSDDRGNAIASTSDGGYILAGTFTSTTERGNGGTDIWLIRVDPFGAPLWNKLIGGSGDETPKSIRVLSDGGFLICGSSSVNQLSSAFIIRTDKSGELTN